MDSVETLLTDPEAFFRERAEDPSTKGPILVVLAVGFVGGLAAVPQFLLLLSSFGTAGDTESPVVLANAIGIGLTVLKPFFMWGLWTVAIYAVSYFFDGSGSFWTLLALVGWGFLPHVFEKVVDILINVYRFEIEGVAPPANATAAAFEEFGRTLAAGPIAALLTAVGILFSLWSAYLLFHATKYARNLGRFESAISVGTPLLVALFFMGQALLGAL